MTKTPRRANEKITWIEHFKEFVNSKYDPELFTLSFFKRLVSTFGFGQDLTRDEFYGRYLSNPDRVLDFLEAIAHSEQRTNVSANSWADVQAAIKEWIAEERLTQRTAHVVRHIRRTERLMHLESLIRRHPREARYYLSELEEQNFYTAPVNPKLVRIRKLTEKDVTISVHVTQEFVPVRGNLIDSGDREFDRRTEDEVIARLEQGDFWAWGIVTVQAEWHDYFGVSMLGQCSYESEEDFKTNSPYYMEMVQDAIEDLNNVLANEFELFQEIIIPRPSDPLAERIADIVLANENIVSWEQAEQFIREAAEYLTDNYGDAIDAAALYNEAIDITRNLWVELYD